MADIENLEIGFGWVSYVFHARRMSYLFLVFLPFHFENLSSVITLQCLEMEGTRIAYQKLTIRKAG